MDRTITVKFCVYDNDYDYIEYERDYEVTALGQLPRIGEVVKMNWQKYNYKSVTYKDKYINSEENKKVTDITRIYDSNNILKEIIIYF